MRSAWALDEAARRRGDDARLKQVSEESQRKRDSELQEHERDSEARREGRTGSGDAVIVAVSAMNLERLDSVGSHELREATEWDPN